MVRLDGFAQLQEGELDGRRKKSNKKMHADGILYPLIHAWTYDFTLKIESLYKLNNLINGREKKKHKEKKKDRKKDEKKKKKDRSSSESDESDSSDS